MSSVEMHPCRLCGQPVMFSRMYCDEHCATAALRGPGFVSLMPLKPALPTVAQIEARARAAHPYTDPDACEHVRILLLEIERLRALTEVNRG